jgi:nucleoid-associated protein YgaU
MQYFNTLPKIIKTDANRNSVIMTDLMARCSIIPEILNNPMVYYDYDVQDGDTPEIVAYKYYGDSYRYWIVLFANQITDPQWDWPLSSNDFDAYITNKYHFI